MTLPRLYPILDTESLERRGVPAETAAEAWLEGGATLLQIRHKGEWTRDVYATAQRVAERCRAAGATYLVDDRADIAALLGAGVHVGQDDLAPRDVRRVVGDTAVVGFSSHNQAQLRAATVEPVDYVAIGPVFATGSKVRPDPVTGVEEVRRLRPLIGLPLVAIGGITRANACQVLEAGADAVAVIADLLPDPCTAEALRTRMEEWQQLVRT